MKELSRYIPEENIRVYLHLFQAVQKLQGHEDVWWPVTARIQYDLNTLANLKFISKDDASGLYMEIMKTVVSYRPNFREMIDLSLRLEKEGIEKKRGRKHNDALDILIYCLVADMKIYTDLPNYGAVADFLIQNEITDLPLIDDDLRQRSKRVLGARAKELLHHYSIFYGMPGCSESHFIPPELADQYDPKGCLHPFNFPTF